METAYIYGLCDPITKQLRYVGKTINPDRRLKDHLRNKKRNHLSCWIGSLLKQDKHPEIFVIEKIDSSEWQEAERFWISYFRYIGADLVNGSYGGLGGSKKGHRFSPEGRARINAATSAACKGKSLSPEHRKKLRSAKLGKKQRPETVEKRRLKLSGSNNPNFGKAKSEEQKRKISESKRGKPGHKQTAESIQKIREKQIGRPKSEETKRRMREARKRRAPFSDEHRAKLSAATKAYWQKRHNEGV